MAINANNISTNIKKVLAGMQGRLNKVSKIPTMTEAQVDNVINQLDLEHKILKKITNFINATSRNINKVEDKTQNLLPQKFIDKDFYDLVDTTFMHTSNELELWYSVKHDRETIKEVKKLKLGQKDKEGKSFFDKAKEFFSKPRTIEELQDEIKKLITTEMSLLEFCSTLI